MKQKIKVVKGSSSDVQDSLYHYAEENLVSVLGVTSNQNSLVVIIELKHKPENYEPYTGITHKDRKTGNGAQR